ncbi:DUF58 domain-containing protein [bacterium]|nr:MAG: DUF58 domain-containing protein [bacterium]RKZ18312.1 MAG: DUF58 domain-containing protein [bacterium]
MSDTHHTDADESVRGIPPDLIAQVRRLEIRTRRIVQELFGGEYHSVFKGQGNQFREVREYFPGDDTRSIDWNVTARMGDPYLKQFEEERELTVMVLADLSASGRFGSAHRMKSAAMAELGALLVFSALGNQDKVGLILFSDEVELFVPPRKSRSHGLRVIRELLYHPPRHRGTSIEAALTTLNRVQKRKAVVFLLSDFIDEGYEKILATVGRRHDLIAMQFYDPREQEMAPAGLLRLEDAETGEEFLVDSSDASFAKAFTAAARQRQDGLEKMLRRAGCDLVSVDVSRPVVEPLQRFFLQRGRRK